MFGFMITEYQLQKCINKMKKTPSSGSDSISGLVIHDLFESIKRILLHSINLSLDLGIYPSKFKVTKLIPQVKNGKDPLDASSYRPISNLCVLGKIFEELFFAQVTNFINETNQLNKDQHGGRSGHSTTTCLVELWEEAKKAVDRKEKVAILALDMSAAYDLCCHKILAQKCRLLKMGNEAVTWITHFLENRSQYVDLGGTCSAILRTGPNGVVQGGKSSGELFLYYMNQLPQQLK